MKCSLQTEFMDPPLSSVLYWVDCRIAVCFIHSRIEFCMNLLFIMFFLQWVFALDLIYCQFPFWQVSIISGLFLWPCIWFLCFSLCVCEKKLQQRWFRIFFLKIFQTVICYLVLKLICGSQAEWLRYLGGDYSLYSDNNMDFIISVVLISEAVCTPCKDFKDRNSLIIFFSTAKFCKAARNTNKFQFDWRTSSRNYNVQVWLIFMI